MKKGHIQVAIRIKPDTSQQHQHASNDSSAEDWITHKSEPFATVWSTQHSQARVYSHFMQKQFLPAYRAGLNCTCFLYGQTGSGKTYTMFGPPDNFHSVSEPPSKSTSQEDEDKGHPAYWGIFPRFISYFLTPSSSTRSSNNHVVFVSMVELYQGQCYDLLNHHARVYLSKSQRSSICKTNVSLVEAQYDKDGKWMPPYLDGKQNACTVELQGQKEIEISSQDELIRVCQLLESARHTNEHALNLRSSRSHCIVTVRIINQEGGEQERDERIIRFVDLAGSEKIKQTKASGQVLLEAKSINSSLSSLGRVLVQLNEGMKFISYRESSLTMFLQDALLGRDFLSIIVTVDSQAIMKLETRSSLNFAERCSKVDRRRKSTITHDLSAIVSHPKRPNQSSGKLKAKPGMNNSSTSKERQLQSLQHELKIIDEELSRLREMNQHGRHNPDFPKSTIKSFTSNKEKLHYHMDQLQRCKQKLIGMNATRNNQVEENNEKKSMDTDSSYESLQAQIQNETLNVKNLRGLVLRQMTTGVWIPPKQSYSRKLLQKREIQKSISRLDPSNSMNSHVGGMDDDEAFSTIQDLLLDFDG